MEIHAAVQTALRSGFAGEEIVGEEEWDYLASAQICKEKIEFRLDGRTNASAATRDLLMPDGSARSAIIKTRTRSVDVHP
jgi:hypothetical protein